LNRAVPASLGLHLVFLLLAVFVGSHVTRQAIPQTRRIAVRLVERPQPTTPAEPVERPQVEPEPVVETPLEQPKPQPEVVPEPVAVPPDTPRDPPPETASEPEPEPVVEPPAETPVETTAAPVDAAPSTPEQPAAKIGTDEAVPSRYQYYIDLLEQRIDRNWHPKQLGFRLQSDRSCTIHFHVEQDGRITRETIVASSGVPLMDRESLKAVRAVGRFMPLPAGLADHSIGVTYIFTLTSGI
jgi:TonB family protein